MGNLGCSCLVDCVEQALWGESALSSEGYWDQVTEAGELDWLEGLVALVSIGVVQVIGCTVRVSGWDTACEGR